MRGLGVLTSFTTGFPAAAVGDIQASADSGTCSFGPSVPVDGHSFTACSALGSGGGSTSWSLVDAIVLAAFSVMMGLALFHLVRRAVTGNSV